MKTRKTPMRVCAGCQEQKSKKEMIRIVRTPEGNVEIDKTGKKSGRGVYICPKSECLEKAYKEHRLERSLKTKVSSEIYEALRKELS
ncbi:RNase P modulator RnpM [uncultured Megasphaera sp.]|uniref:RNase P modulator RnpM n=1 Tax=uncultured Megasphaera sp. TaxID=165188 RepID=UPI0025F2A1FE|nr:YlxR family protein [uncultured Megasphaera sp.]